MVENNFIEKCYKNPSKIEFLNNYRFISEKVYIFAKEIILLKK